MFLKDEDAALDYAVDWTEACAGVRTVVDSQWRVAPAGLVLAPLGADDKLTTVRVSGGVVGTLYRLSNLVNFSDGTRDERTMVVRVEKR